MAWLGNSPNTVISVEYRYIATASQTVFSGVDSRGATLSIDPNNYDIYRNGVKLDKVLNVTSATASAITLGSGVASGDIILINAYGYVSQLGTYKAPDGTAALPSYTFGSDTDTGVYHIGPNSIGFTTGGTKRIEVNSSTFSVNSSITLPNFVNSGSGGVWQVTPTDSTTQPTYQLKSSKTASIGVTLNLYHAPGTQNANDIPALVQAVAKDSANGDQVYGQMYWQITDTTNGSEDATLVMNAWGAGSAVAISLNDVSFIVPRPLDLSNAAAGYIRFPATQNASAGANDLDDYEEGSWTPNLSFDTPGNLSIVTSSTVGTYVKIGKVVIVTFQLFTTTFTHTTASGNLRITGLPFTITSSVNGAGTLGQLANFTMPASTTFASLVSGAGNTFLHIYGNPTASPFTTAHHTTGVNISMVGSIVYHV
jgi:hypothetical protein